MTRKQMNQSDGQRRRRMDEKRIEVSTLKAKVEHLHGVSANIRRYPRLIK